MYRVFRFILSILVLAFCLLIVPSITFSSDTGKVILVVIDRVSMTDIYNAHTPNMDSLIDKGIVGLMTTNTAGSRSQRDAYVTMGAGTRAVGSDKSHLGFSAYESYHGKEAKELFRQISGIIVDDFAIVNLGIAQTVRNNESRPYPVNIGALGTMLKNAGIVNAVIGNCDTPSEHKRYLVSMLMDEEGVVPLGLVDKDYLIDVDSRPYGVITDYSVMLNRLNDIWEEANVIAVQLGDTSRAEDFRHEATSPMNIHYKRLAIEESDVFIGHLIKKIDLSRDLFMIVTPLGPGLELAINNRLTPFISAGKGIAQGLASSRSTRRPGVITNLDIGATILNYFGLSPLSGQLGSPVRGMQSADGIGEVLNYNTRLVEIFNQRSILLRSYVLAQIIITILALIVIIFKRRYLSYVKPLLVFMMLIPLAYLILPLFHNPILALSISYSWLLAGVITLLLFGVEMKSLTRIMLICQMTALAILIDQWTGGQLIKASPLGYDIISGARFYGIGNEYMGVLIGASCAVCGAISDIFGNRNNRFAKIFIPGFLVVVLFTMAYPGLGANVGGTISAGTAFAALVLLQSNVKVSAKHFFAVAAFVLILLTGVFAVDSIRAVDSQSHMGQTTALIRQNGLGELVNIIHRKLSMNIRLLRYTIWTRVFLAFFVAIVVLLYWPVGIIKDVIMRYPQSAKALAAAALGSIMALLTNDSGIVAAATTMIYVAPPMIILVMDRLMERQDNG